MALKKNDVFPTAPTNQKPAEELGSGVARGDGEEQWSSQVEMVELHAETDSQAMGEFTDTKMLLYDKQVTRVFLVLLSSLLRQGG